MLDHTETLKVGERAPEFALEAANRDGVLTLSGFLPAWSADCRVSAGDVVTQLRSAHGSGRVDQGQYCASWSDWRSSPHKRGMACSSRPNSWKKNPVSFPFLLDEDRVVTKNYGLYHLIGMDALNIAHPATLVIDAVEPCSTSIAAITSMIGHRCRTSWQR